MFEELANLGNMIEWAKSMYQSFFGAFIFLDVVLFCICVILIYGINRFLGVYEKQKSDKDNKEK